MARQNNAINGNLAPIIGFSAYLGTTVNNVTGDGTIYPIIFNQELVNPQNLYNPVDGIFVAPLDGLYWIGINISLLVNTGGVPGNGLMSAGIRQQNPGGSVQYFAGTSGVSLPQDGRFTPNTINCKAGQYFLLEPNTAITFVTCCIGNGLNVSVVSQSPDTNIASTAYAYFLGNPG